MKNTDNALISIRNLQTDGGESDVINTRCKGRFYEKNGKYYIMYNDDESASCMIKADKNTVTVRRGGDSSSAMVCESGKECSFLYRTPYGAMQMKIRTDYVNVSLGENGGSIKLAYDLYVNGGCIKNNMDINIKVAAAQ